MQAASAQESCPRPQPAATVEEPADPRSRNGVLEVTLTARNSRQPDGSVRYCYTDAAGRESPNLRVSPGDGVIIHLKNELKDLPAVKSGMAQMMHASPPSGPARSLCTATATMSLVSTNLHFHGLTIPPTCHQDDVLKTSVQPGDAPFEYRYRIPEDEPPGLYWYHPHIHGFSKDQVLGGASGALIVEGIERAKLWKDTAIFITFDEGGGYYDSGYVQPLDYFGDGTRIPLIVVSSYSTGGHISHVYSDHVSILKFIERNWGLETVTRRSRDDFPNPISTTSNPYVPVNSPAIGDLFGLFDFPGN